MFSDIENYLFIKDRLVRSTFLLNFIFIQSNHSESLYLRFYFSSIMSELMKLFLFLLTFSSSVYTL
jgi:hypothetical protein